MFGHLIATYVLPRLPREPFSKNAKNSCGHIFPDTLWRTPVTLAARRPGRSFKKTCQKTKSNPVIVTIDGGRK